MSITYNAKIQRVFHDEVVLDINFWIWLNCGIEFKVCPKNGVETKGVEC